MRSEIIKPVKKVRGGVSVSHEKHTKDMQVKRIPAPETVTLPMSQHIGAPCTPTVKVGDRVLVGQVVGDTDKYVSASVSGKVTAVKEIRTAKGIVSQAVIIENDGLMEEAEFTPPKVETHDDLIKAVRASGAVGLGGAGFPTHVKLNFPQDGSVDTLIINAAECEPYITVDYRECLDNSWDVMSGVHLLKDMLNFKKVKIPAGCRENDDTLRNGQTRSPRKASLGRGLCCYERDIGGIYFTLFKIGQAACIAFSYGRRFCHNCSAECARSDRHRDRLHHQGVRRLPRAPG